MYQSDCVIIKIIINLQWVVPEKIHTPLTDGILEILVGAGLKDPGNPGRRGGVKLEKSSAGVILTGSSSDSNV